MSVSKEQLILYSAKDDNILPLTSACNVKCIFCSHPQNPRDVEVYGIGHRSLEEVERTLAFISSERKIVIGESVTRIMEGEPFLHPQITEILQMIRARFPKTPMQITTNGTLLADSLLDLLENLGQIELYISLNSVTQRGRELLMGESPDLGVEKPNHIFNAIPQMQRRNIPFQGSIVAMPWLTGYEDIAETIRFLDRYGAETVRIFIPGYTKKAPEHLRFSPELPAELISWVKAEQTRVRVPLIVEPPFLSDLRAEIAGVVADSPAAKAGFLPGDEVRRIGSVAPFSRVDAYNKLAAAGKCGVSIYRDGENMTLNLAKMPKERSGVVFAYDVSCDLYEEILAAIKRYRASRPLLMVSTLATPIMKLVAERITQELPGVCAKVTAVPNKFFGGSIVCAGLLVMEDFLSQWTELPDKDFDLALVPGIFLDPWGKDLTGRDFAELEEAFPIPIETVEI